MRREVNPELLAYFKSRKPFSFAHLIRFERPIFSNQKIDLEEKKYVYLTDGSVDLYHQNPRDAVGPNPKYRANRVLNVPAISEYSTVRATSIDMTLDGSAIGTTLADDVTISQSGDTYTLQFSYPIYDKGLVEGDKLNIEIDSVLYEVLVSGFPSKDVMTVNEAPVALPTGAKTVFIELTSEELMALLKDKFSPNYASFVNREVVIYKAYYDEDNLMIGEPYYLYKGIIQDASLEDSEAGAITINWTLNSHWGDFSEVRGRITSDEYHRALDEHGIPQPEAAVKTAYAYDKGFIHSDTAVHLESTYSVQVEKQDVKYKKGFFGIGAKVKVKKYFAPEDRQTELDFQLQGKTLDVIYGVQLVEGSPVFADTKSSDSSQVYVAYSICEGEIAGIYDLIINDNSLICNNEGDFDARSIQTDENTVDVVCYGRADRGDVLEGVSSTSNNSIDFYNTDLVTYSNQQSLSLLTNYEGFVQPLGTTAGAIGLRHENSVRLESPIDMTLSFYSGRPNQRAAPNLVELAQNLDFKIQTDYWTGDDKMEYWGPNHRLLDTAYAVVHYTIGEDETTIPSMKSIVKGKFINCYNYDNSYQHYNKAAGEDSANFELGDYVTIKDMGGAVLDSNVRIVGVFGVRNNEGELETRFRLSQTPSLGYLEGVPSITKFYMENGSGDTWTTVTYNYVESLATVDTALESPIAAVGPAPNGSIQITPSTDILPYSGGGGGMSGVSGQDFPTALRVHK